MITRRQFLGTVAGAATLPLIGHSAIASTPEASPGATPLVRTLPPARERLEDILRFFPRYELLSDSGKGRGLIWTDWEAGIEAIGLDAVPPVNENSVEDRFRLQPIGRGESQDRLETEVAWDGREIFGFAWTDVLQSVSLQLLSLSVLRLGISTTELEPALESEMFVPHDGEFGMRWDINRDVDEPPMMVLHDSIAILDESTIVLGQQEWVDIVLQAFAEQGNSMADKEDVQRILAMIPDDTVNASIMDGEQMHVGFAVGTDPAEMQMMGTPTAEGMARDPLAESDEAVGPMPHLVTFAMSAPAASNFHFSEIDGNRRFDGTSVFSSYSVPMASAGAELIPDIVQWRVDNMRTPSLGDEATYADYMTQTGSDVLNAVARVDFEGRRSFAHPGTLVGLREIWPWVFHL